MAIFQCKIIVFQAQFSVLSAFSVENPKTVGIQIAFAVRLHRASNWDNWVALPREDVCSHKQSFGNSPGNHVVVEKAPEITL